eukprot:scaffold1967_cov199-Alexandrium_tamarense.AAC.15
MDEIDASMNREIHRVMKWVTNQKQDEKSEMNHLKEEFTSWRQPYRTYHSQDSSTGTMKCQPVLTRSRSMTKKKHEHWVTTRRVARSGQYPYILRYSSSCAATHLYTRVNQCCREQEVAKQKL